MHNRWTVISAKALIALPLFSSPIAAQEALHLVHRAELIKSEPTEHLSGQRIWEMHETDLSRTSIVELEGETPVVQHNDGERTMIVLEGNLTLTSAGGKTPISVGDYISIPMGTPYSLEPGDGETPILLGFDVPTIHMATSQEATLDSANVATEPVVKFQSEVMANEPGWNDPSDRGWTLVKTEQKRVNLVEMFSELRNYSHPDADHSLILLSGEARVVTPSEERPLRPGDYVSIPATVPHKYYVDGETSALFVSFDAPAYDPKKTIYLD